MARRAGGQDSGGQHSGGQAQGDAAGKTSGGAAARKPPMLMVCETCRSEEVTRSAWAEWDVGRQRWKLGAVFETAFCHRCLRPTHIEPVARPRAGSPGRARRG